MKIFKFFLPILIIFLLIPVAFVNAQAPMGNVRLVNQAAAGKKIPAVQAGSAQGPHFYLGEIVSIDEDLVGDVYSAGGNVTINGMINGDLLVAGGQVVINGQISEDLRVIGGTVTLNSQVGKNVTVAGGNIIFAPNSQVAGSVVSGAGSIMMNGDVKGNTWLGAGQAVISGNFGQDLNISADNLDVSPQAVIGGNLTAQVSDTPQVNDGAQIGGQKKIDFKIQDKASSRFKPSASKIASVITAALLIKFLICFFTGLVCGSILIYLFPKLTNRLGGVVLEQSMASLGWGLVYLIVTPVVAVLMFISVLAFPLGLITILLYIIDLVIAGWVAALALGRKIQEQSKWNWLKNPYSQLAAGLLLLEVVALLPFLGALVKLVAFLMGLGALFTVAKAYLQRPVAAARTLKKGKKT